MKSGILNNFLKILSPLENFQNIEKNEKYFFKIKNKTSNRIGSEEKKSTFMFHFFFNPIVFFNLLSSSFIKNHKPISKRCRVSKNIQKFYCLHNYTLGEKYETCFFSHDNDGGFVRLNAGQFGCMLS